MKNAVASLSLPLPAYLVVLGGDDCDSTMLLFLSVFSYCAGENRLTETGERPARSLFGASDFCLPFSGSFAGFCLFQPKEVLPPSVLPLLPSFHMHSQPATDLIPSFLHEACSLSDPFVRLFLDAGNDVPPTVEGQQI